jgi:signal transduction histidine kinase/DNA-binding response OmpR family regulator/ligand-binding sensor domain-containing protein
MVSIDFKMIDKGWCSLELKRGIISMIGILLIGLLLLLILVPQGVYLYCQHFGFKYLKNYTPKDYSLQPQNWAILQDNRGMIYVANHEGVAEYDGVCWRKIEVPNLTVRSLAIDDAGTIYVGGRNEIGILRSDSKGELKYVSLLNHINESQRNFGNVWKTHAIGKMIYFRTSKFLFHWDTITRHFKVWEPEDQYQFDASFTIGRKYYIHQRGFGLMHILGDSLKMVSEGEKFAPVKIYVIAPYDTRRLLIGTRSKGFFLYNGTTVLPFHTNVNDFLEEAQLYHGIRLSCGDFALATLRGGLIIIDPMGRLKQIFNINTGLQDEDVKYVFEDSQGNLWLALNNGISKIEYNSPISIYNSRSELSGLIVSVVRHKSESSPNKALYVGTTSGLFYLAHPGESKFCPVPGIRDNCFSILPMDESLLAATTDGVFQLDIKNNTHRIRKVIDTPSCFLERSMREPDRTWVGMRQGLVSIFFHQKNNQWTKEFEFKNINEQISSIVEDHMGNLWLGTLTSGVLKVEFPMEGTIMHPIVSRYDTAHGLPAGEVHVSRAAGGVRFATEKGLFRFHEEKNAFIPDSILGEEFANGSRNIFRLVEDKNKNIWLHSMARNFQATARPDGTYVINGIPFFRLPTTGVNTIYPDPSGDIIWFASNEGLIRYDTRIKKDYQQPFHTYVRRVWVNKKSAFEGYKKESDTGRLFPVIKYENRNLRVEFAAPFFEAESKTRYQYLLEGYDKGWSEWTPETKKDYTNLDAGMYTFRVHAKNVYENISGEDFFQFRVLPPWYRTWWAYLIYALLSFLGIYLIVKWRSWKLVQEKKHLEQTVKERTMEIYEKNILLEEQSEKLKEMDRVKSRFFANISHEFRTPLTLIMGPLEQRLPDCQDKEQKEEMQMMLRNSQRLLTLINQLLDLSKLDSGKMVLHAAPQNVVPFLKGLLGSFESLAVQKKLELKFYAQEEDIFLYYDTEKLEKVISNLLSNACKFTPAGGEVSLAIKRIQQKQYQGESFPEGFVEISISDTGIGISANQLPYIFDRFYQAEGIFSHEHKHKGSGIGLALAKELVQLHHGEVSVQSTEGKGTEFTIRLPLGDAHLKSEEIIEETGAEALAEQKKVCGIPVHDIDREEAMSEPEGDTIVEKIKNVDNETEEREKDVILVVEDNPDVRKYIRGPLKEDFTVVEAADGKEGIDKARKFVPDLIISDIMMPKLDGCELCHVLKTDVKTSHIPIILLTARASEESIIEGLETGADDYITKPFSVKILLTRIKNLIDLRRQLQEKIQREMVLQPTEIAVSSVDQEFMKELKEVIEKNLSDEEFGVDELAGALYMGRATLNRKIRALTGESTNQFIQSYRLKRAAQLLKANFGNVTEVSFEVGFSSSAYFTKCFKEKFHQLPHTFLASESEDQ